MEPRAEQRGSERLIQIPVVDGMGWCGMNWMCLVGSGRGSMKRWRLLRLALRRFGGWTLIWRVRDEDRRVGWLSGRPAVAAMRCDAM